MMIYPANEDVRKKIKHPNGIGFRDTLDQAVDWPNDSFTQRRLAGGSVLLEKATPQLAARRKGEDQSST
jgi:hypothetical protein